jgi:FkbM family methyltransferase
MSFFTSIFPKNLKTYFKKFRKFNALNQLDKKMLEFINYENGYFIECGANDGVDQSNTWYYEKILNWSGVLIEPLSKQFQELKKNRSKKNKFFNMALCSSESNNTMILEDNDLTSSTSKQNNKTVKSNIVSVKSTTLTKILDEVSAPNLIDFFSLDVEGFEDQVIKGINFNKYNFKYFLIETKNEKVINFLFNKNYVLIKKLSYHDLLFKYDK